VTSLFLKKSESVRRKLWELVKRIFLGKDFFHLPIGRFLAGVLVFRHSALGLCIHIRAWLGNFGKLGHKLLRRVQSMDLGPKKVFFHWGQPCCPWTCKIFNVSYMYT